MNYKYLSIAIMITLAIIYLSSIPGRSLPGDGSLQDKFVTNLAHIPAFVILTFSWMKSFEQLCMPGNRFHLNTNTTIVIGIILFAILDEYHQSFTPGRIASVTDLVLDFVGTFFGALLFNIIGGNTKSKKIEL